MGTAVSSAIEMAQNQAQPNTKSEMQQLSALLKAKEAEFKAKLIAPNTANKQIPVDTIIKMESAVQIDVSTAPSEKMTTMIEDMFGASFLKALKGLILGALDTVLGSAAGGEKTQEGMTVLLLHSAVVRVDYMMYAYTLRSDGIKTNLQNGLVFVVTMSTVKLAAVNSEVIALLSGMTAELSMSSSNKIAKKLQVIASHIVEDQDHYTKNEAVSLIRGYFGDVLTEEDEEKINDILAVNAAPAAARTAANELLRSYAEATHIEETTDGEIQKRQQELLDRMEKIYEKINKMKGSTRSSIAEADRH